MKRLAPLAALGAGFVVLVVAWWVLAWGPVSRDAADTARRADDAERRATELRATVARLEELQRASPRLAAQLRALNAALPPTPDLAEFILAANRIAAEAGIDWLSISPSPPAAGTGGGPAVINLSLQIEGGFFQALDYLNRLEDLERLVILDALNISASPSETGGPVRLSITLTGRMFTRAAVPGSNPGSSPAPGTPPGGPGTTTTTTPGATTTTGPATGPASPGTGTSSGPGGTDREALS